MTVPSTPPPAAARRLEHPTAGIVAVVTGILGLTALPLVGSVLAVIFGHQSRREAAAHPERYSDDLGRIGRVLGWIGIALSTLALLAVVGAVLVFMPV